MYGFGFGIGFGYHGYGYGRLRMTRPLDLRIRGHGQSAMPLAVLALAKAMMVADGAEHAKEWAALERALSTYPAFKRYRRRGLPEMLEAAERLALDIQGMLVDIKARFGVAQREQILKMLREIMAADSVEHPAERELLARTEAFLFGPAGRPGL